MAGQNEAVVVPVAKQPQPTHLALRRGADIPAFLFGTRGRAVFTDLWFCARRSERSRIPSDVTEVGESQSLPRDGSSPSR
eukprot:1365894-Prymnesium_polylepis.1